MSFQLEKSEFLKSRYVSEHKILLIVVNLEKLRSWGEQGKQIELKLTPCGPIGNSREFEFIPKESLKKY